MTQRRRLPPSLRSHWLAIRLVQQAQALLPVDRCRNAAPTGSRQGAIVDDLLAWLLQFSAPEV